MLDPAIQQFLDERKADRIKKKITISMSAEEKQATEDEINESFLLDNWLPDAAKRAGQLSIVSHPAKFSHPSAKTSSIIAQGIPKADGFLRTANSQANFDVFGNAAAMDVYKFLSLPLSDNKTVLEHLEQETETIQQQLTISSTDFNVIQQGLLAIKASNSETQKTSDQVKQVYFPVADDYHLLSILTPSGLMFKLRQRINDIRFSDSAKQAREAKKKQEHHSEGFTEIYGLTAIGYGGTKPQNISVLNSQNGGVAYLLNSTPPDIQKRNLQGPKYDFFLNSLYIKQYQQSFETFHRLMTVDYNNANIRQGRDEVISFIIMQVIERAWSIRQLESGWSKTETCKDLPEYQKIWLDNAHITEREIDDEWLKEVITQLGLWFQRSYKRLLGEGKAKLLGDDELSHIKRIIEENKEGLL